MAVGRWRRDGADVAIVYNRSKAEADEAAADRPAAGRRALVVQCDAGLSQPPTARRLVLSRRRRVRPARRPRQHGVALSQRRRSTKLDPQPGIISWRWICAASFLCAKAAAPLMRRQGGGRIINFSDWYRSERPPALQGLPRVLRGQGRSESADRGTGARARARQILVNAIAARPDLAPPETNRRAVERRRERTPLGRWGGAEEIVKWCSR